MEREWFASPGQAEQKAQHTSETETREKLVFKFDPVRPKRKYFNHYANKIYGTLTLMQSRKKFSK